MKRLFKSVIALCLMLALALSVCVGCNADREVVVTALNDSIEIKNSEVESYDFTQHFSITEGGKEVPVKTSYIDTSKVGVTEGSYIVTCTYKEQSDDLTVEITEANCVLTLAKPEVKVKLAQAASYNFKALFTATADGKKAEISDSMVQTDFKPEIGDYTYTVTFLTESKTLTIHVIPDYVLEVVVSYAELELSLSELESFDVTSLFSLYLNEEAIEVTENMIDASALDSAEAGKTYTVSLFHSHQTPGGATVTASADAKIKIVEEKEIAITSRNEVTYPNGKVIDLTTLFTITYGGENIPVTMDMIEGSVDYSKAGDNTITLTYGEESATATVTVRLGVIISYAKSDTVIVRKGTDINTYPFASDFEIIINGMRFTRIPDSCFDLSGVDFNTEGTYTVTLTLKYNDLKSSGGLRPTYPYEEVQKTITYVVRSVGFTISVNSASVVLAKGTTSYNAFNNLNVTVNGINQALTDRKDWAMVGVTYAELVEPIDFTSVAEQTVRIAVYVYGVDEEPEYAEFTLRIEANFDVVARNRIAFVGSTVYARDLFTITSGGTEIPVTDDMLSGKADTFHIGTYKITLEYLGVSAEATVVVYPREMIGTYKTALRTTPVKDDDDDEGYGGSYGWEDDDYGWYSYESGIATYAATTAVLPDLVIGEDGSIKFNNLTAYAVTGLDANTMIVHVPSWDYTLHYDEGIVTLTVQSRIGYSDGVRPLVYFKSDLWKIEEKFTINYGSEYVLQSTYSGYSLDTFRVTSKKGSKELWYGLYVRLESEYSERYYEVKWGEVTYSDGFTGALGSTARVELGEMSWLFTVETVGVGKVIRNTNDRPYEGITFNGTIDGREASLMALNAQYTLFYNNGGSRLFNVTGSDISQMKNGGVMADDVLFLYAMSGEYGTYSYKFRLNVEEKTFELMERDLYFGKYTFGKQILFLDGYGTGTFYDGSLTLQISYTVHSSEITVFFKTLNTMYTYGTSATFYIAPLLNVLTVKTSYNNSLANATFTNEVITDGAIIDVRTTMLAASASARNDLIAGITIRTKDGELEGTAKTNAIVVEAVDFNTAGFYQFTIKVSVGGKEISAYYSVQIVARAASALTGTYRGSINSSVILQLDDYGRAVVNNGLATYSGLYTVQGDQLFIKMYDAFGVYLSGSGKVLATGLMLVQFEGAFRGADYYAAGSVTMNVAGKSGLVIRRFICGDQTVWTMSTNAGLCGEVVEAESVGENIYKVTSEDGTEIYVRITAWGSAESGLTIVQNPNEG